MLRYGWEIYQFLIKGFAKANKRFPNPKEIKFIENTAVRIRNKLLESGVDLEKLNPEDAVKLYSNPPKLPVRPKSKPAGIEAIPLQDPKLREQALKNKLEAQNMQSRERLLEKKDLEIDNPEDMFADGGRVGLMAGGILKGKKILDALRKANKTKTVTKVLTEDELRALGIKENIDKEKIEKFISGEFTKIPRAQKRGLVTRDKEGNIIIKDKYSTKYDPYRKIMAEQKIKENKVKYKKGDPITSENFGETGLAPDTTDLEKARKININSEREINKAYDNVAHRMRGEDYKYEASELADELAQVRYKTDYYDLDQNKQLDLYGEAYDFLMQLRRDRAETYKNIKFIGDEGASGIAQYIKENDPEGYKKIERIVDDINNKNILENFDVSKKTKHADGGLITMFMRK